MNSRIMGDVAIIRARSTYARRDGSPESGRGADVWVRRQGRWLAVSAMSPAAERTAASTGGIA